MGAHRCGHSAIDTDHPVNPAQQALQPVLGQHDRKVAARPESIECSQHRLRSGRVELRCRLIEEEQLRTNLARR